MKKIVCFVIVGILVCALAMCISCGDDVGYILDGLETEVERIPAYVKFEKLYFNNEVLDIGQIVNKYNQSASFKDCFVIVDDYAWILFVTPLEGAGTVWNIASINMKTQELLLRYSGNFAQNYSYDRYIHNRSDFYIKVQGYYRNGIIVLTDHEKLIEYNINTNQYENFSYLEYKFPQMPVNISIDKTKKELVFADELHENKLSYDQLKNTNSVFQTISGFEDKNVIFNGPSYLNNLFDNVQMIGDTFYVSCAVLERWGHTYAVVFEYDLPTNTCKYVMNTFMDDVIKHNLYFVETKTDN